MLFDEVAGRVGGSAADGAAGVFCCGLRVVSMDGSTTDVPDAKENDEHFGRPSNATRAGAFPQVRWVVAAESGTGRCSGPASARTPSASRPWPATCWRRSGPGCWCWPTGTCAPRGASSHPRFSREELEEYSWIRWLTRLRKKPGDGSMPVNRWPRPDGWSGVSGDPHDMAKAGLPESWSPVVSRSHPPESRL